MNNIILIILFFSWFFLSGIFIVERKGYEDWLIGLFIYSIGLYYVYPFILRKNMSVPYLDKELSPERKNLGYRLLLFLPALTLSVTVSLN